MGKTVCNMSPDLTEKQRKEAQDLTNDYPDVFSEKPGKTDVQEHRIKLTSHEPFRVKGYPMPHASKDIIEKEVEKMLNFGVIEKSCSPYASPLVLVKE